MATFKPYTYLQCPCSEVNSHHLINKENNVCSYEDPNVEERTFDPRAARSNYSLYPLEHLLYCEDCQQIRCPRCVLDEIVTWYCPNCLFEVPSSTVKSEGNRCTRSCFQCPICFAPLTVCSLEPPKPDLGGGNISPQGPFILNCAYCLWTTKEIGIQFEKQNGIYAQLSKMKNNNITILSSKELHNECIDHQKELATTPIGSIKEDNSYTAQSLDSKVSLDAESQFSKLRAFYKSQLEESAPVHSLSLGGDFGYGSPGNLSRIVGLYTGKSFPDEISKVKSSIMREARVASEGLQCLDETQATDQHIITRLCRGGWQSTTTSVQRRNSPNINKRFVSELRPTAYLLRTKRSKRCRACRQILSKPDAKIQSTRFRIRLIASSYIPRISVQPLQSPAPSFLTPMKPVQFLLTCSNPLFDTIKVTLATTPKISGRYYSKTTVLCPQFEVGANTDVWDDALNEENSTNNGLTEKKRTKAELIKGQQQAEAGKVWERGRNWASVVLEVVPWDCRLDENGEEKGSERSQNILMEDEDICEIPVFVRVEWETEPAHDESSNNLSALSKTGGTKESRELAYWCVLGVGRIGNTCIIE